MEPGEVIEYFHRKQILCAVIIDKKKNKYQLINENNREVSMSENRFIHVSQDRLDLKMGRDRLVRRLNEIASRRRELQMEINIKELWEVVYEEAAWFDVRTLAELSFGGEITDDHISAVRRAIFEDRIYFKFDIDRFYPNSPRLVEQIRIQIEEEEKRIQAVEQGARWLKQVHEAKGGEFPGVDSETVEVLKSYYLFGKESPHYAFAKEILKRAGLDIEEGPFYILTKLGIWSHDENLDLHRYQITNEFSPEVIKAAEELFLNARHGYHNHAYRRDLTHLNLITIDGQATQDFDDALSVEQEENGCRIGIHITDVSHFIPKGSVLDQEALVRASSIYMPDARITMLPPCLSEDLFSLRKGEDRPAISIMAHLDDTARVVDYEIFPSIIRVSRQLTYFDVNQIIEDDHDLALLYRMAQKLLRKRIHAGAIQLNIPEIYIRVDEQGEIVLKQVNQENPGRTLVSECMVLANWLAGNFLKDHDQPAIYRSQMEPRQRLVTGNGGSLYQNWMQRKFLNRVILDLEPQPHSALGLDVYVTFTSPIRKYFDLVTQRQLRAVLGLEDSYTKDELRHIVNLLEQPLSQIMQIQIRRTQYWILRYLERKIGEKEEALVLDRQRNHYLILLTAYLIETSLPLTCGLDLRPEDRIEVTIKRVDARSGTLTVAV
nr:RNB domain-containing ribonuclease [Desulfobacterales bacterium]